MQQHVVYVKVGHCALLRSGVVHIPQLGRIGLHSFCNYIIAAPDAIDIPQQVVVESPKPSSFINRGLDKLKMYGSRVRQIQALPMFVPVTKSDEFLESRSSQGEPWCDSSSASYQR